VHEVDFAGQIVKILVMFFFCATGRSPEECRVKVESVKLTTPRSRGEAEGCDDGGVKFLQIGSESDWKGFVRADYAVMVQRIRQQ
jgi:hypothetical protein